ncbi:hypothetical protein [Bradyrhizobium sp. ORS 375]|nr:hypothetical protein [Bradyrhizobium sp. ORS 375]
MIVFDMVVSGALQIEVGRDHDSASAAAIATSPTTASEIRMAVIVIS